MAGDLENQSINKEAEDKQVGKNEKKVRKRKKGIYRRLVKQLEFYFSDANLRHSKHLLPLYQADPWLPLHTFLTFNLVSSLMGELGLHLEEERLAAITKALSVVGSESLLLSEDGGKITRKEPFVVTENKEAVDLCTVYVENLPESVTHESLTKIFSEYGEVLYVSLPKFKSGKPKGFAFIELDKSESVDKVLCSFKQLTNLDAEDLASVRTFKSDQADVGQGKAKRKVLEESDIKPNKKVKLDAIVAHDSGVEGEVPAKVSPEGCQGEIRYSDLRVLSKVQWRRLRNKYLNEQRANFSKMKTYMKKGKKTYERPVKSESKLSKDVKEEKSKNKEDKEDKFEISSGVVVKLEVEGGVDDVQKLKKSIRESLEGESVAYVDSRVGYSCVHVRCVDTGQAGRLAKSMQGEVIHGTEETEYLAKIRKDREEKLSGKVVVKRRKNRNKLLKNRSSPPGSSSHTYFD